MLLGGCVVRETRYRYEPPPPVVYQTPPPGAVPAPPPPGSEVVVTEAMPAPLVEDYVVAPGPGFIWIGGYWGWEDRWVWRHGYWGRPPRRGAVWIAPHYAYRGGRHIYIRGGWR